MLPARMVVERIAGLVEGDIVGQQDRQILGRHRLVCGDSTKKAELEKLKLDELGVDRANPRLKSAVDEYRTQQRFDGICQNRRTAKPAPN